VKRWPWRRRRYGRWDAHGRWEGYGPRREDLGRTYVTAASWLAVTALGLAIGVLGAGGLMDLFDGTAPGRQAQAQTGLEDADGLANSTFGMGASLGTDPGGLQAAHVVEPDQLPDGTALNGRAPAARGAKAGDFTPFVPTSMRMPSGRLAPVESVSVHQDGALDIPSNPDRVGWWTGGAEAGEPYGSIVLAGHVDSRTFGVGVLAEMLTMRPGQELKLADGAHGQRYLVQSVRKVPKAKLEAGSNLFAQNLKHRLVMITCGGPFDRKAHSYRDNVILVATPVG
jgi:hypothetical protein